MSVAASAVDAGIDVATGNVPGLVTRALRSVGNAATGKNEAVREQIIEALTSKAPWRAMTIARNAEQAGRLSRGSSRALAVALGASAASAGQ